MNVKHCNFCGEHKPPARSNFLCQFTSINNVKQAFNLSLSDNIDLCVECLILSIRNNFGSEVTKNVQSS